MKLRTPFFKNYLFLLLLIYSANTHARPNLNLEESNLDSLWEESLAMLPEDFFFTIETVIQTSKEADLPNKKFGPEATIFIGGASFKGKEKPHRKDDLFSQNLWYWFKNLFRGKGHYHTSRKSARFLGIIRNSLYSMKFGAKPISARDRQKRKQKILRNIIGEVRKFYEDSVSTTGEKINLIGSSYGSVVAAHVALVLTETGYTIGALTLSASPINENSEIADSLFARKNRGKIGEIIWHPNEGDNISGASGNLSIWKLMFPGPNSEDDSILLPSHPHNKSRKDTTRTNTIVRKILVEGNAEGNEIRDSALVYFPESSNQ